MDKSRKKVVIVGGGTAGWMTAVAISTMLPRDRVEVELVESEAIGIIGVGEATLPHLRHFNETVGIDEREFMTTTHATFKLGIEFVNWARKGDAYIHPFGAFGPAGGEIPFHHFWRRMADEPGTGDISAYSLPIVAAYQAKFGFPDDNPGSLLSTYGYAYQFDATLYAPFLRKHAEAHGARRTEGKVVAVKRHNTPGDQHEGDIRSIVLEDGQEISGDLFIDCTGFSGLLIEDCLETGYEDWRQWLPCDRAVAMQCEASGELLPYTRATAEKAGWRWRIPLQHRVGNGHVYASPYITDSEAEDILLENLEGPALSDPRILRFTPGKRRQSWNRNCVAIGLSGGFLEPLESTSIYLIQAAATTLVELFPDSDDCALERDEYNRIMDNEFIRVRDFLILHYHATERDDSEFWNYVRTMDVPESLKEKMALFRDSGRVAEYQQGLFLEPSWLAVYLGQRILPEAWDRRADLAQADQLRNQLASSRQAVEQAAAGMSRHVDFLQEYCAT